jgi:hypothetical protein
MAYQNRVELLRTIRNHLREARIALRKKLGGDFYEE